MKKRFFTLINSDEPPYCASSKVSVVWLSVAPSSTHGLIDGVSEKDFLSQYFFSREHRQWIYRR